MTSSPLRQRVVDLLVENCGIDRSKLEAALRESQAKGRSLGHLLVEGGLVPEKELLATLSKGLGFPPINLSRTQLDPALAELVPERIARQYLLIPVSRIGNNLSVAMTDPLNVLALDDLTLLTSYEINPVLAAEEDVRQAIEKLYQHPMGKLESLLKETGDGHGPAENPMEGDEDEVLDLTPFGMAGQRGPIMRVVDLMLTDALKARASDIHIEPYEKQVRVRYRIDGALVDAFILPKKHQNGLITRLKIMSRLDITENRLPQDGRFKVRMEGHEVDFRVSILPIGFGNKAVLRVLDRDNLSVGLDELGFLPGSLLAFRKAVSRPYGLILVTGPTGSGKSTTLYSILSEMNDPARNIMTVEDPVEYQVEGITQVQVNVEIGLTFSNVLRAFLRQAPDVVLVGEIRDLETADIAIKASLTGQIVLATLHTNDAPSSISRLINMGVDPFLLASSLIFVAAQRLCRQICPRCKGPEEVKPELLRKAGLEVPKGRSLSRGKGCAFCRNTGFRGRFAILEAMLLDDSLREMMITRRPLDDLRAYCSSHGMKSLRQEGLEHALAGRTSLEEVLRVTAED
ncbi:MAG: ATPase, T2SS/T4P/T4SS family [Candidatus Omnitrophota bacterium]|nr:ATPase, T2SS/T4P/T4SS family [Candidatus Omnitrophota bacterium]